MRKTRFAVYFPALLTLVAFVLALHTSRVPDGSLLPVFSLRTALLLLSGIAAILLIQLSSTVIARRNPDEHRNLFLLLIQPFYLLNILPLAVFVLHPLGLPLPFFTLVQADMLLLMSSALFLFRMGLMLLHSIKWINMAGSFIRARSSGQVAIVLFFGFLAIYGVLIKKEDRILMLVGDEPHYLLMMESMRRYHTADLSQIMASDDPLPNGVRKIRPHASVMSAPGTLYEVHNIGISVMMIPGFSLVGYKGAVGTFGFLAALLVANMFLLGVETTGRKWTSLVVAMIAGFSAPFIYYFRYIYPEMPAALCLIYAVRVLRRDNPSTFSSLLAGAGAAFMPWLHVKFVIMAAILAGYCLFKHFRKVKSVLWYALPHVPSALLLMNFFYHAYGSWLPNAQYGDAHDPVSKFFFRGAPGLLLDRDHGLLAFAPFYWLALPGLLFLYRENRRYFALALTLTIPSFAILASHWMWWGGPCPPARFIIPLIPLFIPAVVGAFALASGPVFRLLAGGSIVFTLILSFVSLGELNALPFHRHFLRWWAIGYDAFPFFPLFFIHRVDAVPRENFVIGGIWILAWCASLLLAKRRDGQQVESFPSGILGAHTGAILMAGGLLLLFPGAMGYLNAKLSGIETTALNGSERPLAHMNVLLDNYTRPFVRAGVSTETAKDNVSQFIIYSAQKLEAGRSYSWQELESEVRERSWIFFGRYTTLYPIDYILTFNGTISTDADGPLVLFDICNNLGRNILWENTMSAAKLTNDTLNFSLPFRPDGIKKNAEFRAAALAPGSFRFEQVGLKASLP